MHDSGSFAALRMTIHFLAMAGSGFERVLRRIFFAEDVGKLG
jgi:hypothetical protein